MSHVPPAIEAAARAARVAAVVFFIAGGFVCVWAVVLTDYSRHPQAGLHLGLLLLIATGLYFIPGGLLMYLARRM